MSKKTYMKNIDTAIRKAKQSLTKQAKRKGLVEDFGNAYILSIEEEFIDTSDYSPMMKERRDKLNNFICWCMNFEL